MILSIFTPVYNRACLLSRIFNSLQGEEKEFEWIIVNDGSTDNTEEVVLELKSKADFPIRYFYKENGGKHTAHNLAVQKAIGDFFLCLDSDDFLKKDFIHDFLKKRKNLSVNDCGYIAYKSDIEAHLLCGEFAHTEVPGNIFDFCNRYSSGGEFTFILKTGIIRNYLFPEIPEEKFMSECVFYDVLDLRGYFVQPFPYVVEICEYQKGGLSDKFYQQLLNAPTGFLIYHMQRIDLESRFIKRIRHIVSYHSFRKISSVTSYRYVGKHCFLVSLLSFTGIPGSLYYRRKYMKSMREDEK